MSYTERDAWLDELDLGDWPFEQWRLDELPLRPDFPYSREGRSPPSVIGPIFYRLLQCLGEHDLRESLEWVIETVAVAIEHSSSEAFATWLRHEVWLSPIDVRADLATDRRLWRQVGLFADPRRIR